MPLKHSHENNNASFRFIKLTAPVLAYHGKCISVKTAVTQQTDLLTQALEANSGIGTGGSGGSMNRGPRAPGAPEQWATKIFRQDS